MTTMKAYKLPPIGQITRLLKSLKANIGDDYRCDEEATLPSMQVTIGASPDGSWSYQTGDNSYSGGAYGHAHWGVISLFRRSNSHDLAKEAIDQIAESMSQSVE